MNENKYYGNLPFLYELHKEPNNHEGIPNVLPFDLTYDERYDLVKQKYSPQVDSYLEKAYKISSVLGGNTTEGEIGEAYANSILKFISETHTANLKGIKVLDIGCGTGYLLHKLKDLGCEVYGIEPGQQALIGIEKYGIEIDINFFPPKNFTKKFDFIISTLVLEHISEPEIFLNNIKNCLNENGVVIIGVPDEEPYISSGDISTLFHEHWNYFTKKSLFSFLDQNGAANITIENSSYGGILYAKFNLSKKSDNTHSLISNTFSKRYLEKIDNSSKALRGFFQKNSKKKIGVYVPGRIINFLKVENISVSNLRFFDDDLNSYNMYYPGINVKVENFRDCTENPPDILLIMSSFFGQKIKEKILTLKIMPEYEIYLWSQFFEA
jgi:2-polyprenyl-3-methyl-5-hydroxy-6-metoxy-1,4-benzoquinol methylase